MRAWLRRQLRKLLDTLETPPSERDAKKELRHLLARREALRQDRASLDAMLRKKKDSFHHSIAAGTTVHAESLIEQTERLEVRIADLQAETKEANEP